MNIFPMMNPVMLAEVMGDWAHPEHGVIMATLLNRTGYETTDEVPCDEWIAMLKQADEYVAKHC